MVNHYGRPSRMLITRAAATPPGHQRGSWEITK
jgi:hypothetical protein